MALKPQDIVVLTKMLAHLGRVKWSQRQLAEELCISLSEVNGCIKRLLKARLLTKHPQHKNLVPIVEAATEFLIHAVKYQFPVELGELTPGIPTGYASPVFKNKIVLGNDPIPVWPSAKGGHRGLTVIPLYESIPTAIHEHYDENFYFLLTLIDVLRIGRAREKKIAEKMIKELLQYE